MPFSTCPVELGNSDKQTLVDEIKEEDKLGEGARFFSFLPKVY